MKSFERKDFMELTPVSLSKHLDKNFGKQIINTTGLFSAFSSTQAGTRFLSEWGIQPSFH